jgi:hypothetical protein
LNHDVLKKFAAIESDGLHRAHGISGSGAKAIQIDFHAVRRESRHMLRVAATLVQQRAEGTPETHQFLS